MSFHLREQRLLIHGVFSWRGVETAIIFAALYAVILLAAVKVNFGTEALYALAVVSGMTDLDAFTFSTAHLFSSKTLEASAAWRVILIFTLANLIFKGTAAAFLGSRSLMIYIGVLFGLAMLGGIIILAFWPDWEITLSSA